MELEEVFTSPFTTQTTCYSSGRSNIVGRLTQQNTCELHFATENHILGVRLAENDVQTACRPLSRDSAQMTCVGYASLQQGSPENSHKGIKTAFAFHHVEAMALIDPELLLDNDASAPNLHRPSTIVNEKEDNTSVATPGSQFKRSSTLSTASTAANVPLGSASYHRKSQSELSKASHTTIASDTQPQSVPSSSSNGNGNSDADKTKSDDHLLSQPKSKARLVLKQNRYTVHVPEPCDENREHENERQLCQSAFAMLDFRPLCPCIATWGEDSKSSFLGIWVGSADDAILRLYYPSDNDPRQLVPIRLPEEHFSVDSPIMALDFCSVSWNGNGGQTSTHTLAVACQDGTIQLITWTRPSDIDTTITNEISKSPFGNITSQKVIVDGPLVCLKLEYNPWTGLRVIVGSLCGFVCQLTCDFKDKLGTSVMDSFWEGPYMVAQDLFHSSLDMEESVLTVDIWENYVAVGTQLGRCLLYATQDSENYFLIWEVVLPYPVHNVTIVASNGASKDLATLGEEENETHGILPNLAVATRRSFHVFKATASSRGVFWKQKPKKEKYSSELAMQKLGNILEGIQRENQVLDSTTRKFVQETIDNLLETVESSAEVAAPQTTGPEPITTTTDSDDPRPEEEKLETGSSSPTDAPHWEYSSSDEEEGGEDSVQHESLTEDAEC